MWVGSSGAGKTSLLMCLGGLTRPAEGRVAIGGVWLDGLRESERDRVRRERVGFVFQAGDLVPELNVVENVGLPLRLQGVTAKAAMTKAVTCLESLGIDHLADRAVADISGGELQRAAIARAVVHSPAVVFADEPTGALDDDNAEIVFQLLLDHARTLGAAVVLVTHDRHLAARADRVLRFDSGRLAP